MSYGLYMSAAGAHAQSHRMQTISHNLANVDTPGFKPQSTVLQSRFAEMIDSGEVSPGGGGIDDLGGGVTIGENAHSMARGPVKQTGRRTDFAIGDDDSFFVVRRDDEQMLTRAGNFTFDSSGMLVTQRGDAVMSTTGGPIQIDPRRPFEVGDGGWIRQDGTQFQLMLGKPASKGDLAMADENHFRPLASFDVVPPRQAKINSGAIEGSAVSPTTTMLEMIETTRVYEANVRMIQNQDTVTGNLISKMLR